MAEHQPGFSHDAINRYLMEDEVSPNAVWQAVEHLVSRSGKACLIFDDTILDKRHSVKIELARRQYSGNEHGVVKGIGVVNCVYVNLDTGEHWIIDWRVYDPDGDGKSKLDHVRDRFDEVLHAKKLPFRAVLMDSWYATKNLMMHIDQAGKVFYCPIKSNRKVDDSQGEPPPTKRFPTWNGSATKCCAASSSKSTGSHGTTRSNCSGSRRQIARNTVQVTTFPRIRLSP